MVPNRNGEPAAQDAAAVASGSSRIRRPPLAYVFLAAGVSAAALAAAGVFGAAEPVVLFVTGLATLVALVASVWYRRPSSIWPWAAIAVALGMFLAAGVLRGQVQTMGDLTASRSLLPDLLALPGYALLALGLLGFARRGIRDRERQSAVILDGLLAALGARGHRVGVRHPARAAADRHAALRHAGHDRLPLACPSSWSW